MFELAWFCLLEIISYGGNKRRGALQKKEGYNGVGSDGEGRSIKHLH